MSRPLTILYLEVKIPVESYQTRQEKLLTKVIGNSRKGSWISKAVKELREKQLNCPGCWRQVLGTFRGTQSCKANIYIAKECHIWLRLRDNAICGYGCHKSGTNRGKVSRVRLFNQENTGPEIGRYKYVKDSQILWPGLSLATSQATLS